MGNKIQYQFFVWSVLMGTAWLLVYMGFTYIAPIATISMFIWLGTALMLIVLVNPNYEQQPSSMVEFILYSIIALLLNLPLYLLFISFFN